jgi:adenylate cyclase class IV
MASNVEWKPRARDQGRQRGLAERLAGGPPELLEQAGTFFIAPQGRPKLRRLSAGHGELIYYDWPDQAGPKRSDHAVGTTDRSDALQELLAQALGVRGEAPKRRRLYRVGPARVPLDLVEGLGAFLEVEVLLRPGQPVVEGERLAEELRCQLDVRPEDLVDVASVDLLAGGQAPQARRALSRSGC